MSQMDSPRKLSLNLLIVAKANAYKCDVGIRQVVGLNPRENGTATCVS